MTRAGLVAASLCLIPSVALALDLPRQGMSMDDVRQSFGAPAQDMGAVGKPPITRWVYDGFTVYFEGRRVLHTVRTQPFSAVAAPVTPAPSASSPQPAPMPAPATPMPTPPEPAPATVRPVSPEPAATPAAIETLTSEPEPVSVPEPILTPEPIAPAALAPSASEPAPEPTTTPPAAAPAAGEGFRFDPATGRLIIDGDAPQKEPPAPITADPESAAAAPAPEPMPAVEKPTSESASEPTSEPAPEPSAEPAPTAESLAPAEAATPERGPGASVTGNALDESLEFDPETGTFRPKQ